MDNLFNFPMHPNYPFGIIPDIGKKISNLKNKKRFLACSVLIACLENMRKQSAVE